MDTPIEDFNGRLTRAFLAELLQRLNLPAVDPAPEARQGTERYLQALKAGGPCELAAVNHAIREGGSDMNHRPDFRRPKPTAFRTLLLNVE